LEFRLNLLKYQDYTIRDYKAADFEEVNNLWVATEMGGIERGDDNEVIQRTIKSGGKLIILEHNPTKELIGTSWLTHDNRRVYLHHFGIRPDYQGKGLSKILFNESLDFAKSLKMQIKLEVHKNNLKATELYKKGGFQYLGDYRVFIIRDLENAESMESREDLTQIKRTE
jgi:ribosomal protein S18 acetylase RimI-like enzyme